MMKISIITVCYNSEKYIEQTIKSVLGQTYPNIEYIIVDGMSTDSTPDIIEKYKSCIAIYIRGKDKNMYDAINKGMRVSTGEYIAILNSDDYYVSSTVIQQVVDGINEDHADHDIFGCNGIRVYEATKKIKHVRNLSVSHFSLLCARTLAYVGHSKLFISRNLYHTVGEYDCDRFRAAADYDYILRATCIFNVKHLNVELTAFRVHGNSITATGGIDKENNMVLEKNGYYEIPCIVRFLHFWIMKLLFMSHNLIPSLTFLCQ